MEQENPKEMNLLLTVFLLLLFDLLWISFVGKWFNPMVENIQGKPMNVTFIKGIIAYTILILFAYIMIPKMNNYYDTFLLGFFTYSIYESTNFAIFNNWNPIVAIADSLWGGVLLCLLRYFCTTSKY